MKPIKIFWSELSNKFYASRSYTIKSGVATITGQKFDVTQDIASAIIKNDILFSIKKDVVEVDK